MRRKKIKTKKKFSLSIVIQNKYFEIFLSKKTLIFVFRVNLFYITMIAKMPKLTEDGPLRAWVCVLGGFILCLSFSADFRSELRILTETEDLILQLPEPQYLPHLLHAGQWVQP